MKLEPDFEEQQVSKADNETAEIGRAMLICRKRRSLVKKKCFLILLCTFMILRCRDSMSREVRLATATGERVWTSKIQEVSAG